MEALTRERSVVIRILNEKGVLIGDFEREFDVRRSDWNVGIGEVELVGEVQGSRSAFPQRDSTKIYYPMQIV